MEWKHSRAETDARSGEEHCLVWALRQILTPRLSQEDEPSFLSLLQDVFPQAASSQLRVEKQESQEPLEVTIREVMKEDQLLFIEHLQEKVSLLIIQLGFSVFIIIIINLILIIIIIIISSNIFIIIIIIVL